MSMRARCTMPAAVLSPMTVNAASAARNWVTGSSLSWPSRLPFLAEAQNSHAVNKTRSARETFADPVAAVVITSSNRALVAGLCAAVTTFVAVKFLLRYFQTNRLSPFGVYCMCAGAGCLLVFALGG